MKNNDLIETLTVAAVTLGVATFYGIILWAIIRVVLHFT